MTDVAQGQALLKSVSQMREFFAEVSLLLRTADEQMVRRGWDTAFSNYCVIGTSQSVQYPAQWMPYFVYRLYKLKPTETRLAFICAILDVWPHDRHLLTEPVISGIVLDYPEKIDISKLTTDDLDAASWHVFMPGYSPDQKNDGTVLTCDDPAKEWPKDKCKASRLRSFGHPLAAIMDSKSLEQLVVAPLDALGRTDT